MSEEFKDITNWAAIVGVWDFANGRCVYKSPDETSAPHPLGICVSNIQFSEGTVRTTVSFSETENDMAGRVLLGYRSPADPYVLVGFGGHGRAYTIYHYEPAFGWRGVAFAGSQKNLVADRPYNLCVRVQGQRILLEVDSVQVLDHALQTPIPQGQLGLSTWGNGSVVFKDTAVGQKPGTVFVVMQFSDPYQDLYSDVIRRVIEESDYNLHSYHVGEVFGPGIILDDIVRGIIEAKIIIAEITPPNQNVFYELGYAHAFNKPTILLADKDKQLPFDIRGYRCLFYENTIAGKGKVEPNLNTTAKK